MAEQDPAAMPWRCFHCDEVFFERDKAREHFSLGNYEAEMPLCVEAATTEQKALVLTNREMWERVQHLEREVEDLEYRIGAWQHTARALTGAPSATSADLRHEWDFMEGRVLAAETAINAAPAWLAGWLRRRAERRERRPC